MHARWDIFCNVIDNYGDVGVAWRLARDLARGRGLAVRLWIDDLGAFQRIWPAIERDVVEQTCEGVVVRAWRTPFEAVDPGEVVIEAFGCALPETYLTAMSQAIPPPVWVNLEYLTAESWTIAHHGLPSPHPRLPLTKHFFFPGYVAGTGGLLIEAGLRERRAAFVRSEAAAFRQRLGLPVPAQEELTVSLFAYENPALPGLLDAWAADAHRVTCLVPEGRIVPQLAEWLSVTGLHAGDAHQRGALQLRILPFLAQDDYDRLLWTCDLSFVRGEDSCVRSQLAARPMVWQAYPQPGHAHWDKVAALLALYTEGMDPAAARALGGIWRLWNGIAEGADTAACWAQWRARRTPLEAHALAWSARLEAGGRLTDALVDFVGNALK